MADSKVVHADSMGSLFRVTLPSVILTAWCSNWCVMLPESTSATSRGNARVHSVKREQDLHMHAK